MLEIWWECRKIINIHQRCFFDKSIEIRLRLEQCCFIYYILWLQFCFGVRVKRRIYLLEFSNNKNFWNFIFVEPDPMGCVEVLATLLSILLLVITFPISMCICFKVREYLNVFVYWFRYLLISLKFKQVVQEYERAVIFRLGRIRTGGARGPGIFFVLPCIDTYRKVDLRTVSFDVPSQEVSNSLSIQSFFDYF